ncbi:STAS domain-containing protein [Actinophytocola xinjiangensis]|nr:STAS domain-containing protein [Actinophytocola xinjiangensis]
MSERPGHDDVPGRPQQLMVRRIPYRADLLVVTVAGEVDLRTAPVLAEAFDSDTIPVTVVDLTRVTFLSAAGLGVLVEQAERAQTEHRHLGLVAQDRVAIRVLRSSGVAAAIPTFDSLSDAMRELGARASDQP